MKQPLTIFCLVLVATGCGKDPNAPAGKTTPSGNVEDKVEFDFDQPNGDCRMGRFDVQKQAERIRSLRALSDAELLKSITPEKTINGETVADILRRGSAPLLAELQGATKRVAMNGFAKRRRTHMSSTRPRTANCDSFQPCIA